MFSCEYCGIFKNTYFEKHLQTAAFGLPLLITGKHRWCLFIASNICYHLKIYRAKSCVQILLNCDGWRKYVLYEAYFFSSHILGGFGQCVWFRTSLFWTSAQKLFLEFGKCLEKHMFWTRTNGNYRKKFL